MHIPDSDQAPHQAMDKRYYARVAGKSRPISHRLVLDILGRRNYPKISIECSIESVKFTPHSILGTVAPSFGREKPEKMTKVSINFTARNVGQVLAKYLNCKIRLPYDMLDSSDRRSEADDVISVNGSKYVQWTRRNVHRDVLKAGMFGLEQYGPSWFDPILPGLSYSWDWDLRPDLDIKALADRKIYWSVFADNAPVQSGSFAISEVQFTHTEKD